MTLPSPGDAARAAFEAEQKLSKLNAEVKLAREDKVRTRAALDAVMEGLGVSHVGVDNPDGKNTLYYYKDKPHFDVQDEEALREWAEQEDESYFDPEPALREKLVFQECRRRYEEKLPLPPGIVVRADKELHKRTV
jgi:hypothetical protein